MSIKIGIYCIENLINSKKYFGQSIDLNGRLSKHKSKLKHNCHENKHLQGAYNKYGVDNFRFYIVEECEICELDEREKYYIALNDSDNMEHGYNIEPGGNKNKQLSDETKEKLRLANLGKKASQETKEKISIANKGRKIPDEQRQFLRDLHIGSHLSEETKKKISQVQKIPVYCKELNRVFDSGADASKECASYGVYKNGVSACIRGKQKYCGIHPITGEPLTWENFLKE